MWRGPYDRGPPRYYSYCYQCGGNHEEGTCRFLKPQWYEHHREEEQYVRSPENINLGDGMKKMQEAMDAMVRSVHQAICEPLHQLDSKERLEQTMALLNQQVESMYGTKKTPEVVPPIMEEPQARIPHPSPSPSPLEEEDDSDDPPWLPALREMQERFWARGGHEHYEDASEVIAVEEAVPVPRDDIVVHEPIMKFVPIDDSDTDSEWDEPVPVKSEPPTIASPWYEWEDTEIAGLWCSIEEDGETMSIVVDELEVHAPIQLIREFSMSYVDQSCDELEKLLYGDSLEISHVEHTPVLCAIEESEVVDDEHHRLHSYVKHDRVYYWEDFIECSNIPASSRWKKLKRKNCKMKDMSFSTKNPPHPKHSCVKEKKLIEKRWWKKKKWRVKSPH